MIKYTTALLVFILVISLGLFYAQSNPDPITGIAGIKLGEDISNFEQCDKDYPDYLKSYHCQLKSSGHNIGGIPVEGFSFIFNEDKKLELMVVSVQEDDRLLDILKEKFSSLTEVAQNIYRYSYSGAYIEYSINYRKKDPKADHIPKRSDMERVDAIKLRITDYQKWKKSVSRRLF